MHAYIYAYVHTSVYQKNSHVEVHILCTQEFNQQLMVSIDCIESLYTLVIVSTPLCGCLLLRGYCSVSINIHMPVMVSSVIQTSLHCLV